MPVQAGVAVYGRDAPTRAFSPASRSSPRNRAEPVAEITVAVAKRNIGGYRPDADPCEPQFSAPGKPSEWRQKPHATATPREKAATPNLIPAGGEEPD